MRVNVCLAHVWNIFAQQRVLVNQQAVDMFGNKDFSDNSNIIKKHEHILGGYPLIWLANTGI